MDGDLRTYLDDRRLVQWRSTTQRHTVQVVETRRAAKYRRISRDREGRELGIERQDEDLDELATRRRLVWTGDYFDNDLSASTNSRKPRPDYDRMLRDARAGRFDVIAAYTTSRLTRRPREFEDLIDLARQHGIEFVYIRSPEFDLSTAQGREIARIMAARDAGQAEQTAELVQRAARQRAERGDLHGGHVPYGYIAVWDRGKMTSYEPHPDQAAMIREAYERIFAGETVYGLAVDWNRRGIPTLRGAPWTFRTIQRVVTGPSIAGQREYDGQFFAAKWPAIVPVDDWHRVRDIVGLATTDHQGSQRRIRKGVGRQKYALSGLVWCDKCDRRMAGSRVARDGEYIPGFTCTVANCGRRWIRMDHLEEYILDQLCEVIDVAPAQDDDDDARTELRKKIGDDERRLQRLGHMFDDDDISEPEYKDRRDRLTTRLDEHRARLAELSAVRVVVPSGEQLKAVWPDKDDVWKRTILGSVIRKITVLPQPPGMATHVTQRAGESAEEYATRLDLHRARVLDARVRVDWYR